MGIELIKLILTNLKSDIDRITKGLRTLSIDSMSPEVTRSVKKKVDKWDSIREKIREIESILNDIEGG